MASRPKYYEVVDGEWIAVPRRGYKEQCCGCGLVHRHNFRIGERGRIEIQSAVDNRATAAVRRTFKSERKRGSN